jgi:hypothetical protein
MFNEVGDPLSNFKAQKGSVDSKNMSGKHTIEHMNCFVLRRKYM